MSITEKLLPKDNSDKLLLASNIATIFFALILDWGLLTIMWGYWLQSVIIGFFNFLNILFLTTKQKQAASIIGGIFLALFFALHYGMFHFVYMIFLGVFSFGGIFGKKETIDIAGILLMGITFFINHLYSFWLHRNDEEKVSNQKQALDYLNKLFAKPYARIFPMHITIIFGAMAMMVFPDFGKKIALVLFLSLKTLADQIGHQIKYKEETNKTQTNTQTVK